MFILGDPMCGHITPYQDSDRFPALQRSAENLGGRDVMWPTRIWRSLIILSLPTSCIIETLHQPPRGQNEWIFAETTSKSVTITNNKQSCYNTDNSVLSVILSDPYRHDDIVHHSSIELLKSGGHDITRLIQCNINTSCKHVVRNGNMPTWTNRWWNTLESKQQQNTCRTLDSSVFIRSSKNQHLL